MSIGMRAYSQDIRDRVIASKQEGRSTADIVAALRVSRSYVDRVWQRFNERSIKSTLKIGGHRIPKLKEYEAVLRQWVEQEPGLTLQQLCERCKEQLSITVSTAQMWRHLGRMGLRFKKNDSRKRAGTQ